MNDRVPNTSDRATIAPPVAFDAGKTLPPAGDTSPDSHQSIDSIAPLPTAIARFQVQEFLGEGSFGIVYRCYDPQLDRMVALKVAKTAPRASDHFERFRREARASAGLRHPYIVPLFDTGEAAGQFYLASAYVPGTTLEDALHERAGAGGFAARDAAEIARKLAEALAYAHGQGIVHRDVKTANVMLDPQGEPHLLDFGLALRNEGADRMTLDGSALGTPAYLAPEVATGRRDQWGPATDQYALGVVLYELLTGRTPFSGPVEVVMSLLQTTEPPRPSRVKPSVPRDLEAVCLKCLEKAPARRYADCQALADDLRRWLDGESTRARPAGLIERATKWTRRNPAIAALSAAVVTLFLGGFALVTWQWFEAVEARRAAESAKNEATTSAATAVAAEAKAKSAAEELEAVNLFLVRDLIESANPEKALGRKVTVEEVLVSAAQRLGTRFASQPKVDAAVRESLGNSFLSLGQYDRAEPLLRDALTIQRREAGERDPRTLTAMNDLAVLHYSRNQLAEAEELFARVVAARSEVLGATHLKTLESMNNLAALRAAQPGRWQEAKKLYEQVLADRRLVLGPGHPETLITLNNLAQLLDTHEPTVDVVPMFREAIDGLSRAVSADHPDALKARNNLGVHFFRKNKLNDAEAIFKEVLAGQLKVSGAEHADTLQARNNLSAVLFQNNKLDEAVPMARAVLEAREKLLGPNTPATLQSANNLGYMLLAQAELLSGRDKFDDAEVAVKSAEEVSAKLAANHWLHLDIPGVRGAILMARKQYKDAEPLVLAGYEKLKDVATAPAARKQAARERVIKLYESTGRNDQAAQLRTNPS